MTQDQYTASKVQPAKITYAQRYEQDVANKVARDNKVRASAGIKPMGAPPPVNWGKSGIGQSLVNNPNYVDTAKEPTLRWQSDSPDSVMYNPGGGTNWSALQGETLTDPTVIGMLRTGAAGGGLNSGAYQNVLSKVKPATMQGIEGSKFSLAPDVLNKMWR